MDIPPFIPPMLATPGRLFESAEHLYEPKWDGIRCLAFGARPLRLMSRNGNNITTRFPEMAAIDEAVPGRGWVLDGELIVLDDKGRPSFDLVRDRNLVSDASYAARLAAIRPAALVVFDLLYLKGSPMLDLPLAERRQLLHRHVRLNRVLTISPGVVGGGWESHRALVEQGMEGTVIKKLDSPYVPGQRSKHWVKVRHVSQADCVVGGFTARGLQAFGSLLLGQYHDTGLRYVGHVGSGFSTAQNAAIAAAMQRIVTSKIPFAHIPRHAQHDATWVLPLVVCTVEYLTWTKDGLLRHPVFRGIRTDKRPVDCSLNPDHPLHQEGKAQ